eukprot:TRINITY_DN4136_c0_g1_i1.p1 TRINITY_DN4136_c0_g1~~TRINITY_DN4136_c0_g1_i1.p1  ORF type:complete len:656 (+),score=237.65 TRINITY_DN4136_c0_g1_i1:31-1968(+)
MVERRASEGPYRLALVGCGRMGSIRHDILVKFTGKEKVKLTVVVDPIKEAREAKAAEAGCAAAATLEEVIDDIDCVLISTPSQYHVDVVRLALKHNKPVMCEKPLALEKSDVRDCIELSEEKRVPLMVGFNRRQAKEFRELKKAIDADEVFRVHIENRDNPMPPPEQLAGLGDFFDDFAVHDVDMALWLMGEKPLRVAAHGFCSFAPKPVRGGAVDNASMVLEFSRQRSVTVEGSRFSSNNYDQRAEALLKGSSPAARMDPTAFSFPQSYKEAYTQEVLVFADIVAQFYAGEKWSVERPSQHCLWVSDVVSALQESAKNDGVTVQVPGTDSVKLSVVGRGGFAKFQQEEVLNAHLFDRFDLVDQFSTAKPFAASADNNGTGSAVYVVTPDTTHRDVCREVLAKAPGTALYCEKPALLSLGQYRELLGEARRAKSHVQLNFQRRTDSLYIEAREAVQTAISRGSLSSVVFTTRDPVPADPNMHLVLHNSVIHDFDSVAWMLYPHVVSLKLQDLSMDATTSAVNTTIDAELDDGSHVSCTIDYAKGHTSYLNRVDVTSATTSDDSNKRTKQRFENDFTGSVFFDRYKEAYVKGWTLLYRAVECARRGVKDTNDNQLRLDHPSFADTYALLDQAFALENGATANGVSA